MVAIINTGRSVRAAFMYNENKLEAGVAELIMAQNYPMELADMDQQHRLQMLLKTAAKNENVSRASVHISLNFSPDEQLPKQTLQLIAAEYMDKIGFGNQPFLVYEHKDVAHQHLHIVSVKVRPDGSRIDMQNIGKLRSEPARKELENKYGLIRAEDRRHPRQEIKAADSKMANYGKSETRKAIYNVLTTVLKSYKYTSLAELNAVLSLYNVAAEQGTKDSRTYKHQGLLYRVLDGEGKSVGVPIKASLFPEMSPEKPGLRFLAARYKLNQITREPDRKRLRAAIDFALVKGDKTNLEAMITELAKGGITTVLRQNKEGLVYGITFIDHISKAVFNGSELGKQYAIKGIMDRCGDQQILVPSSEKLHLIADKKERIDRSPETHARPSTAHGGVAPTEKSGGLLEDLFHIEYQGKNLPSVWKKKKKRKKRSQSGNL